MVVLYRTLGGVTLVGSLISLTAQWGPFAIHFRPADEIEATNHRASFLSPNDMNPACSERER